MKIHVVIQEVDEGDEKPIQNLIGVFSEESIARGLTESLVDSYYYDFELDPQLPELFGYKRYYFLWLDEYNKLINVNTIPDRDVVELFNPEGAPRLIIWIAAKNIKEAEEKMVQLVGNYKTTPEYAKIMGERPENLKPNPKKKRKTK